MFSMHEHMIIYFPMALKFYSFGDSIEDSGIIKQVWDILQNDERVKENGVDIVEYFRLKDFCKQFAEKAEENKKKKRKKNKK